MALEIKSVDVTMQRKCRNLATPNSTAVRSTSPRGPNTAPVQFKRAAATPLENTGPLKGAALPNTGLFDGAALAKTGPLEGAALPNTGPFDGVVLAKTGPLEGAALAALARTGPLEGAALAKIGPLEGTALAALAKIGPLDGAALAMTGPLERTALAALARIGPLDGAALAKTGPLEGAALPNTGPLDGSALAALARTGPLEEAALPNTGPFDGGSASEHSTTLAKIGRLDGTAVTNTGPLDGGALAKIGRIPETTSSRIIQKRWHKVLPLAAMQSQRTAKELVEILIALNGRDGGHFETRTDGTVGNRPDPKTNLKDSAATRKYELQVTLAGVISGFVWKSQKGYGKQVPPSGSSVTSCCMHNVIALNG
ncbi:hypothetical protein B0H14DRAFT_2612797 [Mycena olivaceomarginata]|nr:hypothetical protein B0H14DRAFT_2612797 [Mycena olivaceomarginata]